MISADISWTPSLNNVSRQPYTLVVRGLPAGRDLAYSIYVDGIYTDSCYFVPGIFENEYGVLINTYPNPASDFINIQCENIHTSYTLCLYTITGSLIYTDVIKTKSTQLEVSNLSPGVYILTMENQNFSIRRKVLVYGNNK
jgi:hypothetical protein